VRTAVIAALILLATAARADDEVFPDLRPEYYDTEVEAATAGLQLSYDRSNAYEYGGIILHTTNGKFRISNPETDYRGDGVVIEDRNDIPGYSVVGDFHTHPCLPYSHFPGVFSDRDVYMNDTEARVGFMLDMCSGIIRRYVPGVTPHDKCWAITIEEAILGADGCGSYGVEVSRVKITKLPIMQEIPGPKTKARGFNSW